jgi:hypothetical protein
VHMCGVPQWRNIVLYIVNVHACGLSLCYIYCLCLLCVMPHHGRCLSFLYFPPIFIHLPMNWRLVCLYSTVLSASQWLYTVRVQVCGLPLYWKSIVWAACGGTEENLGLTSLTRTWRRHAPPIRSHFVIGADMVG